jgi:hypothetical protein
MESFALDHVRRDDVAGEYWRCDEWIVKTCEEMFSLIEKWKGVTGE